MDSIEVVATGILSGKTPTACKNVNKLWDLIYIADV